MGFLGLKATWSTVKNSHGWEAGLLLGIAGNNSGAGGFQRWYHKIFIVSDPPVWVGEMDNSFHANSYLKYRKEWTLAPNPFSITLALDPKIAFGTRDQYTHADIIAYFGRRDPLVSSMSYQRIEDLSRGRSFFPCGPDIDLLAIMPLCKGTLWETIQSSCLHQKIK